MHSALFFLGRILMSSFFFVGAYWHITNWGTAVAKTQATGVLFPNLTLVVATLLLIAGGSSLLLGYKTRLGVVLLLIEVIFSALLFNKFWTLQGLDMQLVLLAFQTRMAICGGLLFLFAVGPGKVSIDSLYSSKEVVE